MQDRAAAAHPMRRLLSNRRTVLAGAAAMAAAALQAARPEVAQAAPISGSTSNSTPAVAGLKNDTGGGAAILGATNAAVVPGIGIHCGVYGQSDRPGLGAGYGVYGFANGLDGTGVKGDGATGVYGSGLLYGVWGQTDGTGGGERGVLGRANGSGTGVRGEVQGAWSNAGAGVVGVAAGCEFGDGANVGVAGSGRGADKTGVLGITDGGIGVDGWCTGAGIGVRGLSNSGAGPDSGGSGAGVDGRSGGGLGVRGQAASGTGVYGISSSGTGVQGVSTSGIGVYGVSTNSSGCGGTTLKAGQAGLFGYGSVAGSFGFVGGAAAGGQAGYFNGTVTVNGAFQVVGGPKNALVPHPDGSHRRMYCQESPEPWFEDFGQAQLQGGKATVRLDPDFAAVVKADAYSVFPIPEGACEGLYVATKTPTSFEVRELRGGTSSVPFSYRLVARRKEDVGKRMEKVDLPKPPTLDLDRLPRPAQPERPGR